MDVKYLLKRWLPDKWIIRRQFKNSLGYNINFNNPKTFNEKLQWLKLNDRKTQYSVMVDKYLAKLYVSNIIGKQYIIPTLGVWDNFRDIDFELLPKSFVLKCTNDSGGVVVCKDKNKINKKDMNIFFRDRLSKNYFYNGRGREWVYKDIKPRIIAEEYIGNSESNSDDTIVDYKFMCFNGIVKCTFVCTERKSKDGLKVTFYDNEWNKMPFQRHYPSSSTDILKPNNFELMKMLAEKLSKDIPFLRVDFYEIDNKVYFGETTFYPGNGFEEFNPLEWDYILGEWLQLPNR